MSFRARSHAKKQKLFAQVDSAFVRHQLLAVEGFAHKNNLRTSWQKSSLSDSVYVCVTDKRYSKHNCAGRRDQLIVRVSDHRPSRHDYKQNFKFSIHPEASFGVRTIENYFNTARNSQSGADSEQQ